jgi:hypothetical protein
MKKVGIVISLLNNPEGRCEEGQRAISDEPRGVELKKLEGFSSRKSVDSAKRRRRGRRSHNIRYLISAFQVGPSREVFGPTFGVPWCPE